ncbi:hypothetical protein [Breoghania sp.]|uniref:hypothetical protein n=1 Tax=Breoghania sp. TaxID=2065378 RepID=UPI0026177B90|nr:hypothetical protein [Breoghania sp.]
MFLIIVARERELQNSIRNDTMWVIHQFDRETRELAHVVELARAAKALGDPRTLKSPTPEEASLRYDILYSRLPHLEEANLS